MYFWEMKILKWKINILQTQRPLPSMWCIYFSSVSETAMKWINLPSPHNKLMRLWNTNNMTCGQVICSLRATEPANLQRVENCFKDSLTTKLASLICTNEGQWRHKPPGHLPIAQVTLLLLTWIQSLPRARRTWPAYLWSEIRSEEASLESGRV